MDLKSFGNTFASELTPIRVDDLMSADSTTTFRGSDVLW